jgi:hypothetical protein
MSFIRSHLPGGEKSPTELLYCEPGFKNASDAITKTRLYGPRHFSIPFLCPTTGEKK